MLVQLSSQAKQLDDMPEVWDTGGQRVLLETAPADVLLVRVVLRATPRCQSQSQGPGQGAPRRGGSRPTHAVP